ncbi:MAG: hypothetical protein KatS3mg113_0358 [Planctomycetaceae bacterium]|nr:MAG: hypothetical protein KatS3mg113_0358 [Planctomycetaceae bacterium]
MRYRSDSHRFGHHISQTLLGLIIGLIVTVRSLNAADQTSDLQRALEPLVQTHRGQVSLKVKHLETGIEFNYRAGQVMPTASLIKLPVMMAVYEAQRTGRLSTDAVIHFREEDRVPGSGVLRHLTAGIVLPWHDVVRMMIAYSDNMATNGLLQQVGLEYVNELLAQWGCRETRINSLVFRRETSVAPERSRRFGLGCTTAEEMLRLVELLVTDGVGDPQSCQEMRGHMLLAQDAERFTRYLPPEVQVGVKTGAVEGIRTAAGWIRSSHGTVLFCILTAENEDRRWHVDQAAWVLMARVLEAAYQVFADSDNQQAPDPEVQLRLGSHGELVRDLQRTLNMRLSLEPPLQVDGEFGPITEAAVKQFQQQSGLMPTGVVEEHTWRALGTIPPENIPGLPARRPEDPLDGVPWVTCPAWLVAEVATGRVLGGQNVEQPRHMASTTKIMTAWLVLKHLDRRPELAQQRIRISWRAARTPGSTAELRAGEQISVEDLLYGLMLPSGNDAAVALAEHLGNECQDSPDVADLSSLQRFVREMNREAERLGLRHTQFRNPHGLTEEGHHTSPLDLFVLTRQALQHPQFRQIINTPVYQGEVHGPGGYRRSIVWRNTNQLLQHEGYYGVKTGTTQAAGACLVSLGERRGQEVVVVVLGSTSAEGRYVDTRNLFRWGWKQLGIHESPLP